MRSVKMLTFATPGLRESGKDVLTALARLVHPSPLSEDQGRLSRRAQFVIIRGPLGSPLASKIALYDEYMRNRSVLLSLAGSR